MKTIKSTSGKKAVNISRNGIDGDWIAMYVQIDELNQREQVLETKFYSTEKKCINWANKVLS